MTETKESIRQMLKEAREKTPKDNRQLIPISYKGNKEVNTTYISFNGKESSFDVAKRNLIKLLKNIRVGRGSAGWDNGKVKVIVEKEYDLTKEFLDANPDQKEKYFKYGGAKYCDYRQKVTNFYLRYKNGENKKFSLYGKVEKNV